jgi:hypothetical protein
MGASSRPTAGTTGGLTRHTRRHKSWDNLKEDFKVWKKLMRQTGTGWCPIKGTIVMHDD